MDYQTDTRDVLAMDTENTRFVVNRANRVFDLIENWLNQSGVKQALEHEKNKFAGPTIYYVLDIPATIAAYYLFYMVTVLDKENYQVQDLPQSHTRVHAIYQPINSSMHVNVQLLKTMIDNQSRLKLNSTQQINAMIECGFSIHFGFIWSENSEI